MSEDNKKKNDQLNQTGTASSDWNFEIAGDMKPGKSKPKSHENLPGPLDFNKEKLQQRKIQESLKVDLEENSRGLSRAARSRLMEQEDAAAAEKALSDVDEALPKGGLVQRVLASFVDLCLLEGLRHVVNIFSELPRLDWQMTQEKLTNLDPNNTDYTLKVMFDLFYESQWQIAIFLGLFFIFVIYPTARSGKTLGKSLFGIRVISNFIEGRVGIFLSIWREIFKYPLTLALLPIQILLGLFLKNGRMVHDFIFGTKVIAD